MNIEDEQFSPITSTDEQNYVFECRICNAGFSDVQELFTHAETHTDKNSTSTTMPDDYMEEIDKPYSCIECSEKFDSYEELQDHMGSHSKESDSILSIISQDGGLGNDEADQAQSDASGSDIATGISVEEPWQKQHIRSGIVESMYHGIDKGHVTGLSHSGKIALSLKTLSCQFCGKSFGKKDNIKKHIRIHTGEKPYSCPYCSKWFACPSTRKKHIRVHTGEKPYFCALCGYQFSQSPSLKHHALNIHGVTDPKLYVGKRDGTPFLKNFTALDVRKAELRRQSKRKSASKKKVTNKQNVFKGQAVTKSEVSYCAQCDLSFNTWTDYEKHLESHNVEEQPLICTMCRKHFHQRAELNIHVQACVGPLFACSYCPKAFSIGSSLTRHSRNHTGERPYRCNICKLTFTELSSLTKHLQQIHRSAWFGQQKHKLKTAPNNMKSPTYTANDAPQDEDSEEEDDSSDDAIEEESLICRYCRRPFKTLQHLNEHERTHTVTRPYECVTCGRCFGYRSHLNRHILIHTGEKPFKCWICKMRFRQNVSLKSHVRVHHKGVSFANRPIKKKSKKSKAKSILGMVASGKQICVQGQGISSQPSSTNPNVEIRIPSTSAQLPSVKSNVYTCNVCQKSFGYYSSYTRHRKTHAFSTSLKCPTCGKTFRRRMTLVEHMRIHTGEKPCVCDFCGNKYRYQSHLTRHLRLQECGAHIDNATEMIAQASETKVIKEENVVVDEPPEVESYEKFLIEKREGVVMRFDPESIKGEACVDVVGDNDDDSWQEEEQRSDDNSTDNLLFDEGLLEDESDPPYEPGVKRPKLNRKMDIVKRPLVTTKAVQSIEGRKCAFCSKKFTSRSDMRRHMRTHSGQKPFICTVCGSKFTQKKSLVEHSRLHTGERPHCCEICNLNFRYRSHLGRHLRRSHNISVASYLTAKDEPPPEFCCIACQKEFDTLDFLRQHLESVHHIGEDTNIADEIDSKQSLNIGNEQSEKPNDSGILEKTEVNLDAKVSEATAEGLSFKCEFCECSFEEYDSWIKHISTHSATENQDLDQYFSFM